MNYIVWIIIAIVVVVMAIIGYVAENKNKPKTKKAKENNIPEVNIAQIEAKEGANTWSKNAAPKDEKQEKEHKVATIDDWSKIPPAEHKPAEKPQKKVEETNHKDQEAMFSDVDNNKSEIKEVRTEPLVKPPVSSPSVKQEPTPVPAQSVTTNEVKPKEVEIKTPTNTPAHQPANKPIQNK